MSLRAWMMAACVMGCAHAPASEAQTPEETPEAFVLSIDIGRYGVMLSHVADNSDELPDAGEVVSEAPRELARRLRETVWTYNLQRSRLCARGLFVEASCGPALSPAWMTEPDAAEPTLAEVEARSEEVGAHVMALWDAVCESARARVSDEEERMYVCAIE